MYFNPKREENESFIDFKKRQKEEKDYVKWLTKRGFIVWDSYKNPKTYVKSKHGPLNESGT